MEAGFKRATASSVAFYHPGREVWAVVHGDDFAFTDLDEEVDFVLKLAQKLCEIQNKGGLGSGPSDVKEIDILGRTVRFHDLGLVVGGRQQAPADDHGVLRVE